MRSKTKCYPQLSASLVITSTFVAVVIDAAFNIWVVAVGNTSFHNIITNLSSTHPSISLPWKLEPSRSIQLMFKIDLLARLTRWTMLHKKPMGSVVNKTMSYLAVVPQKKTKLVASTWMELLFCDCVSCAPVPVYWRPVPPTNSIRPPWL
jgi:hypothetical protein